MSLFKRFSFWLPALAVLNYVIELIWNPYKEIVFGIDLLLAELFWTLNRQGMLYNNEQFKILFPGFLLHFFLWLIYGLVIGAMIYFLFKRNRRSRV